MSDRDWITSWLSEPRWAPYLQICDSNSQKALELYEWNLQLAGAIMHDIAHIEVGIHNNYDQTITSTFHGDDHWLFDNSSPVMKPLRRTRGSRQSDLNSLNRRKISEAKKNSRRKHPTPGQVIAELNLGFWCHLTDAAQEKTLWVPHLHHAYPAGTDRKQVDGLLKIILRVRNRASHHEPLFTGKRLNEVIKAQNATVTIARMLLPPLADHIQSTSRVNEVLTKTDCTSVLSVLNSKP